MAAGIKAKKLTAAQVRKELRGRTKEELSSLLEGVYKSCPDAANYLNIRFAGKDLDASAVKDIAQKVWEDVSLIDEYLAAQGAGLPQESQAILKSWQRCVNGRFVLERNLKKGSILISLDDSSVYQVRGIKSSFEEIFSYRPLPVMLSTALLPFKGVLITDGLMATMNIFIGSGMKKQFKDIYTTAKRRNQIKTSL